MSDSNPRMVESGMTRADLLKRTAAGALTIGAAGLISACGSSGTGSALGGGSTAKEGKPVRGGNLRVGMTGNGTAETLNPTQGLVAIDAARALNLFEGLVWSDQNLKIQPVLATQYEPNKDATVWTIKLRKGVTWHNGKPFGADDVIYSLRAMGSPSNFGHPSVTNIKLRDLKKINEHEVEVPLYTPNGRLLDLFAYFNQVMIPDGEKSFSPPIGTGPFKYQSFTAGRQSVFERFDDYWEAGKPYVDSLTIISIDEPEARLNALKADEIDLMDQLAFPDAKVELSSSAPVLQIFQAQTPSFYTTYMNQSQAPFNDVRVRQAMMSAIDRQQLVDVALSGFGTVGNDIAGKGLELFNDSLPPKEQDIEKARTLLKEAGHTNLDVTLSTSPIFLGFVESATLMQQQVKEAGINIKLEEVQPSQYLTPPPGGRYLTMAFGQDKWPIPSLSAYYTQALQKGAFYNETHEENPEFEKLLSQAIAAVDPEDQQRRWNLAQEYQYENGGNLIWCQPEVIDAGSQRVSGMKAGGIYELGNFTFKEAWFNS